MMPMGVFGGTFDPIHYGHLRTAFELLQALHLAEVRFLPCGDPPHRGEPLADASLRLEMVRIATEEQPGFVVDDRELKRQGPSYSVDTMAELRKEYPDRSLCLILGMDAFLGLPGWHNWQELIGFGHIVVAHRPGWTAPRTGALGELLEKHGSGRIEDLHQATFGRIYVHAVTQLEIASTDIRDLVAAGHDPRFLMPDGVRSLIIETGCYRREQH